MVGTSEFGIPSPSGSTGEKLESDDTFVTLEEEPYRRMPAARKSEKRYHGTRPGSGRVQPLDADASFERSTSAVTVSSQTPLVPLRFQTDDGTAGIACAVDTCIMPVNLTRELIYITLTQFDWSRQHHSSMSPKMFSLHKCR